jgi:hypothetical protein
MMMDDHECVAVGGIIGKGRKPTPVQLCPPQIPHDLCSNKDLSCEKPTTSHLNYGTAFADNKMYNVNYRTWIFTASIAISLVM